jgi:hypothetical protein
MTTYLTNSGFLVPLIQWGGLVLILALVLCPFFIIRLPRFKPTKWRHIIGAYLISFVTYFATYYLWMKLEDWILNKHFYNYYKVEDPFFFVFLWTINTLILSYPLLVFYSTKLLYGSINRKRFYISLGIALLMLAILIWILILYIFAGLAQIGNKYF